MNVVGLLAVVLTGVLAGEELLVRWGVQPALRALPDLPHLLARQALVRRLRIVVPAVMLPAAALTLGAVLVAVPRPGTPLRIAGAAALAVFLVVSFAGTVPVNIRVDSWDPTAPPDDWRGTVVRWERIDVVRSTAALVAFVLLATALAVG
ncbi:DUF1772 domain-containing protein [Amnibacterium sp. CER49]|uniref:DUF1772 domain-containing protein n=1 Tax=Amnibacterium sp. CER49 TaxID=3039161 RepID=UPI00244AA4EF|nr:DUF1772 domain-containing protein [Amnibacterium sp. CER49]MDH2442477.1 DUF1772 domain-containing protein [Amnibacterium sp. CER49]